jgi:putative endonuclease
VARWFCYLLECADGSLYAGITNALGRRVARHNDGTASKYTRPRRPVRLVWSEPWPDRAAASRREAALKRLPRARKLTIVMGAPKWPPYPQHSAAARATRAAPRRRA